MRTHETHPANLLTPRTILRRAGKACLGMILGSTLAAHGTPVDLEESPAPDLPNLFPEDTLLYVEGAGLSELLKVGLEHPFVSAFFATDFGRGLTSEVAPKDWLAFVDLTVGRSVLEGLSELTANGVAFGLAGEKGDPRTALVVRAEDADAADELREDIFDLLERKTGYPGALDRPQRKSGGMRLWNIGEALVIQRGATLTLANSKDYALAIDECSKQEGQYGLMRRASFRERYAQRSGDGLLWAYADRQAIERSFDTELGKLALGNVDPGIHTLLGAQLGALGTARTATAELALSGNELHLKLSGFDTDGATTLFPQDSARIPPVIASDADLAHALLYRDFARIMTQGSELFAPRKVPKLAEVASQLGLFFGGQDVGEDVLPYVSPWLRLVSRPLTYTSGPKPEIPLPALALIGRLERAEDIGPQFLAAFQTIVSIIGVDQAQKRGRPFLLSVGMEGQVPISTAHYLDPHEGDGVDMRYNLRPACAIVGDALILGTHEELVRALVRDLEGGKSSPGSALESLRLDGPTIAELLRTNFETLVMNKVLEDGVTQEKAREEIGGLESLARSIQTLYIELPKARKEHVEVILRAELVAQPKHGAAR